MAGPGYDLQTDTHLSRDFNKLLQTYMHACSTTGFMVRSTPHYDLLKSHVSALDTLYINTFFLFFNIKPGNDGKKMMANDLMTKMEQIYLAMELMEKKPEYRNKEFFKKVVNMCRTIHMMIMFGLQQRKMLVRMSESEPKGVESLNFWETKTIFKKGDVELKDIEGTSSKSV